jgi:hypothetical protein
VPSFSFLNSNSILEGGIFIMKKYTIQDLKNISDDEVFNIVEAIVRNKIKFSDECLQIVCDELKVFSMVYKDQLEYCKMSELAGHIVLPEEYNALKKAYIAEAREEWPKCKSALEVFFEWMGSEDILNYDLSVWDYHHLLRWFNMLSMTGLCDEPEGTTARIFAGMVNEQIVNRMPKYLKPKLWDCVENVYPELAALFEVSKQGVDLETDGRMFLIQ